MGDFAARDRWLCRRQRGVGALLDLARGSRDVPDTEVVGGVGGEVEVDVAVDVNVVDRAEGAGFHDPAVAFVGSVTSKMKTPQVPRVPAAPPSPGAGPPACHGLDAGCRLVKKRGRAMPISKAGGSAESLGVGHTIPGYASSLALLPSDRRRSRNVDPEPSAVLQSKVVPQR